MGDSWNFPEEDTEKDELHRRLIASGLMVGELKNRIAELERNRLKWLDDVLMEAIGNWGGKEHECFNLAIKKIKAEAMREGEG